MKSKPLWIWKLLYHCGVFLAKPYKKKQGIFLVLANILQNPWPACGFPNCETDRFTFQAHPDAEALLEATERTSLSLGLVYFALLVLCTRVSLVVLHGSLEEALEWQGLSLLLFFYYYFYYFWIGKKCTVFFQNNVILAAVFQGCAAFCRAHPEPLGIRYFFWDICFHWSIHMNSNIAIDVNERFTLIYFIFFYKPVWCLWRVRLFTLQLSQVSRP